MSAHTASVHETKQIPLYVWASHKPKGKQQKPICAAPYITIEARQPARGEPQSVYIRERKRHIRAHYSRKSPAHRHYTCIVMNKTMIYFLLFTEVAMLIKRAA